MAEKAWFYAADGKQQGPHADAQFRDLIARGTVRSDTLVWSEGMAGWRKAGEVPGLMPAPVRAAPPPVAGAASGGQMAMAGTSPAGQMATAGGAVMAAGAAPGDQITTDMSTFGLFGRSLAYAICYPFVIPVPWVATWLYGWMIEHLRVPQRPNIGFTGKALDIWYVFILFPLSLYVGLIDLGPIAGVLLQLIVFPLQAFLWWMVVRWVISNISSDGRPLGLSFQGGFGMYLLWYLFYLVSFLSIIGWAWVSTAWGRWMCRNIAGTRREVVFNASGWGVLWRSVVGMLLCIVGLLIPLPWVMAWLVRWTISQISVVERTA